MAEVGSTINKTIVTFNALMVIGFLGIVWLMIYGNLSGNLGFQQTTSSFINETITLQGTGDTPAGASDKIDATLSDVVITNATGGEIVVAANYTITGVVITNSTPNSSDALYVFEEVNVTYTVTHDSAADVSSENVINNLTQGANTFFTFSNTLFTIVAIVLLITILIGLLFIVMQIVKAFKGKGGSSFSA